MRWQVEVAGKEGFADALGNSVAADVRDLGISGISQVRTARIFILEGDLGETQVRRVAGELLSDPIIENYAVNESVLKEEPHVSVVRVMRKPGVMDPVAHSTLRGIRDMRLAVDSVTTAHAYALRGDLSEKQKHTIAEKILANAVIEDVIYGTGPLPEVRLDSPYEFKRLEVDMFSAPDDELVNISKQGELSLNLAEMHTIRDHFKALGRNPTDLELEALAQTWSEHCVHKTFRGLISCDGTKIDNLLKSTIAAVTRELNKPWCVSVFEDNAGVIEFDDDYCVCFKVETHNHPSALDPYGGAGTGIGGVIRDPLGTGLGAKPIVNTDIFCFGPPDYPFDKLPTGTLHPKRIFKGVVAGVRDYGNRMGIPTVNGAIFFDERYVGNPLVYCG
ncbi:MAG: phosphoribosylformylglycinamidine synthase subunit PurS, partial [Planctomycetes bacterium]|nr:phosphoribosylformylglycinamidine synthase subunit PurS [Planctomycetota bacterium]